MRSSSIPPTGRGIEAAARAAGVRFDGIWLEAPLDVLRARIRARRADASDATVAVLEAAARADPGPIAWHRVDAAAADPLTAADALISHPATGPC